MQACLFPKGARDLTRALEACHSPEEVARRVLQGNPNAVTDWSRGDEMVDARLQDLLSMRAPDVIVASHRLLFGHVVYIELSYPEWPNHSVFTYVYGPANDGLSLEVSGGFDIKLLIHAAREISQALNYEFELTTDFGWSCEVRSAAHAGNDPRRVPLVSCYFTDLTPLPDWSTTMRGAVLRWLSAHADKPRPNYYVAVAPDSPDVIADAFIELMNSISPVQRGWNVKLPEHTHEMYLLIHEGWATTICLSIARETTT